MNPLHAKELFSHQFSGPVSAFCSAKVLFAVTSLSGLQAAACRDHWGSSPWCFLPTGMRP
jgi:hypothetical protein